MTRVSSPQRACDQSAVSSLRIDSAAARRAGTIVFFTARTLVRSEFVLTFSAATVRPVRSSSGTATPQMPSASGGVWRLKRVPAAAAYVDEPRRQTERITFDRGALRAVRFAEGPTGALPAATRHSHGSEIGPDVIMATVTSGFSGGGQPARAVSSLAP
jgi:hypothetical protein